MNIKIERHDRSLNENEKIEFRKSETWRNWRETVAESQDRRDFVTGEPLKDNWNCHHLCLKSNEYTILEPSRFVAVNEKTHKQIHENYKLGWRKNVSNDNPYAESIFKTLKYRPNYQPKGFDSITEARLWVKRFVEWYNNEHRHSGIQYVTPSERHEGKDKEILENRQKVYEDAKARHPERWQKETRNWSYKGEEWLNPERKSKEETKSDEE